MVEKFTQILKENSLITKIPLKNPDKEVYRIKIVWDYNDADYTTIEESYLKKDFEEDLLLQLLLIYFDSHRRHVEDLDNSMLGYLSDFYGLMGYGGDHPAHSIISIEIQYIDKDSVISKVDLSLPEDIVEQSKYFDEIIKVCDNLAKN